MPNRSIRDERDVSKRAGAPGKGSLFGKKDPPGTPKSAASGDEATRDLSAFSVGRKLRGARVRREEEAGL